MGWRITQRTSRETGIRQVGPNKQGAKGSYTVYRVAE
jgi:hypothetical protein